MHFLEIVPRLAGRLVVLCALLLPALGLAQGTSFPAEGLKSVRIETEAGDVRVIAGQGPDVTVETSGDPSTCAMTTEVQGDELLLAAKKVSTWYWFSRACKVGFSVELPRRLAVSAETGAGNIQVSALKGAATLKAGAGNILLQNLLGDVKAQTGSGDIKGNASGGLNLQSGSGSINLGGLASDADAQTGQGDVTLSWTKAPTAGSINVQIGSGNATLAFPARSKFHLYTQSAIGQVSSAFADASDAAFEVHVKTGLGNITVAKTPAAD